MPRRPGQTRDEGAPHDVHVVPRRPVQLVSKRSSIGALPRAPQLLLAHRLTFVVVMVAVIGAQGLFSFMICAVERAGSEPDADGSGASRGRGARVRPWRTTRGSTSMRTCAAATGACRHSLFVVTRDGHVAGNGVGTPAPEVRAVRAVRAGPGRRADARSRAAPGTRPDGQAVRGRTCPGERRAARPRGRAAAAHGRRCGCCSGGSSWPGTIVLVIGTIVAAILVFAPARRRLKALEAARGALRSRRSSDARAPKRAATKSRASRGPSTAWPRSSRRATRPCARRIELRRQMLADVSHELKTPLTSIRGYIETLQMPEIAAGPRPRARYFATMEHETRRLERIVADLLDLARYESGMSTLEPRVFSIERLFAAGGRAPRARGAGARRHHSNARRRRRPTRSRPIRIASTRPSITWWRTRCATRPAAAGSRCRRRGTATRCCCRSWIRAKASPRSTWRTCSSGSTRSTRRARAARPAAGSACPS